MLEGVNHFAHCRHVSLVSMVNTEPQTPRLAKDYQNGTISFTPETVNVSEGNSLSGVIHNDTIIEPSAQWEKT